MKYFIYTVIGIVAAAIIAGFFVVGSPKEERARRFDEQRIQSLQIIQSYIGEFYRAKNKIPQNILELNDEFRGVVVPRDPETGKEFEYNVTGPRSFTLCAQFNRPSSGTEEEIRAKSLAPTPFGGPFGAETWGHGEGRVCFERAIDPDFFPPIEKPR